MLFKDGQAIHFFFKIATGKNLNSKCGVAPLLPLLLIYILSSSAKKEVSHKSCGLESALMLFLSTSVGKEGLWRCFSMNISCHSEHRLPTPTRSWWMRENCFLRLVR